MGLLNEQIAFVCHQANKAICEAYGDHSQVDWIDAPKWQKESAVDGVEFCRAHPEAPPNAAHENWLKMKMSTGWKYGPVKDPEKREHPCMVPYDQLPVEQRVKDHVFKSIVASLSG